MEGSKGYKTNRHERGGTPSPLDMAIVTRRSIMYGSATAKASVGMRSGAIKDGAYGFVNTLFAQTVRQLGFVHSIIERIAMSNSGFSNSMNVAEFRYIQAIHETSELQNPDGLVGQFLPILRRWRCTWLSHRTTALLRSNPFYYYLDARTRYYDKLFLDAFADNVHYIINVGSGVDTRAYRFEHVLSQNGVMVLECDP